ncbi:hypothetical protein [Streptomyces sp. NBC_00273]|uniref:hypothetical protein n=1 Tax=Streptomyces sp. NBC_00273 TaxID=2903644 RepID=UPI002E2CC0F4|nr:hypothetical protein [Streptomyces sp. NBC_00273]
MDLVVWAAIAAADQGRRVGMPRLRAALALRRAPMARVSGDQASRRNHLEQAIGPTRSLLCDGVGRTVVPLWPVDDWVTPLTRAVRR